MGSEAPGIGGVPGIAQGKTRAPQAWAALTRAIVKTGPAEIRRSQRIRARMLRARR